MRCVVLIYLLACLLRADAVSGIRPRESSADYTSHQKVPGATIAAAVIPPDQVKKLFATDLNAGGYIVIEVGIYPEGGAEIGVSSGDFLLRVGSNPAIVRNASARAIAAALQRPSKPPEIRRKSDINVYPTATIGYESGTDPYGRRRSGVYTAAGVGVGQGEAHERVEAAGPKKEGVEPGAEGVVSAGAAAVEDQEAIVLSDQVPVGPQVREQEELPDRRAGSGRRDHRRPPLGVDDPFAAEGEDRFGAGHVAGDAVAR